MGQRNYYLKPDGKFEQAVSFADHVRLQRRLSPKEIVALLGEEDLLQGVAISAEQWKKYFLATALHETDGAWNEVDVEDSPPGFTSRGLCQISDGYHFDGGSYHLGEDECAEVGLTYKVDLLDPRESARVMLFKAGKHARAMLRAVGASPLMPPPDGFMAYLALSHNEGIGTYDAAGHGALGTLARHYHERGFSWSAYKLGNGACVVHGGHSDQWDKKCAGTFCTDYIRRIGHYGDDCITGGPRWAEVGS